VVRWPDGPVEEADEEFEGGAVDRCVVLKRGTGHRVKKGEGGAP
jgi:hypothetical protein